jgi:hypothetical protein
MRDRRSASDASEGSACHPVPALRPARATFPCLRCRIAADSQAVPRGAAGHSGSLGLAPDFRHGPVKNRSRSFDFALAELDRPFAVTGLSRMGGAEESAEWRLWDIWGYWGRRYDSI